MLVKIPPMVIIMINGDKGKHRVNCKWADKGPIIYASKPTPKVGKRLKSKCSIKGSKK